LGLPDFRTVTGGKTSYYKPSDYDYLCAQGVANILPGIKASQSLLNNLLELKDFKSLPKTTKSCLEMLDLIGFRNRSQQTLRAMFRNLGDAYLQKEFNVAPVVRDVFSTWKALRELRGQIDRLFANEGKYLSSHWATSLTGSLPDSDVTKTAIDCKIRRTVAHSKARFGVSIDYTYSLLEGLTKEQALVLGMMDALGLNLNPSIIWNAIPWSFVVDWVLGVNRWLDQFTTRNIRPKTVIHRCMASVSVKREINLHLAINVSNGTNYAPVSRYVEESYTRDFFDPGVVYSIQSSGVSLKEFTLATALATSKLTGRRRS
jgi:hypothetical protein